MKMGKCMPLIAILAIMSLAFTSCSKDDDNEVAIDLTQEYDFTVTVAITDLNWIVEKPSEGLTFSDFVACTHNAKGLMFKEGAVASPLVKFIAKCTDITDATYLENLPKEMKKMEDMPEYGNVLKSEDTVTAGSYFKYTFRSTLAHRYISIAGKLMPSPDWFVGIRDIDLNETKNVMMYVYDAGTDGGKNYTENAEGEGSVSLMREAPLAVNKIVPTIAIVYVTKTIAK